MSYRIGMNALRGIASERLAHTEYCSNNALKRAVTGLPDGHPDREHAFMDAWEIDFIWHTNDGPEPWEQRGRTTDMGHAEFLEGGVDLRQPQVCPFETVEEAWAFDAVAEYGFTDKATLVDYYESLYQTARAANPDQVWTGGYYRTLFSGAIAIFGWDMLLLAASEQTRFARVIDSIYRQVEHHCRAWAETSIKVYMCHDDMVWTMGPFMNPDFYRAEIFPRYKALWRILHDAGKLVAYTSDGDWGMFVDDIVDAGADALCFEPMTALDPIVARYGQSHCLMGSKSDARTLTFGTPAAIRREIDETIDLAMQCPGFMFAVGNHIPSNVPVESALAYYRHLSSRWRRTD